jgi:hypothetical protein
MRIIHLSFSLVLAIAMLTSSRASQASPSVSTPVLNATSAPTIVIGFVGGFVKHDNAMYLAVQLAARLRRDYPVGAYVRVFENRRGKEAHAEILRLLDSDRNGVLSAQEKEGARIVLYGQSWGASETVTLARMLQNEGIPVRLTIQVDSVQKVGQTDGVIPPNVARAVNFYQPHGYIHGRSQIVAADPARTKIIGNFRFDYREHPYTCPQYSWFDLIFAKSHLEIECDPTVWSQIETLVRSELPQLAANGHGT